MHPETSVTLMGSFTNLCSKPPVGDDVASSNVRVGVNLSLTSTISALHNIVINMACMSDQNMLAGPGLGRHIFHLSPELSSAQVPTNSIIGRCRRQRQPPQSPCRETRYSWWANSSFENYFHFYFRNFAAISQIPSIEVNFLAECKHLECQFLLHKAV